MSRDMCPHGWDVREQVCVTCTPAVELLNHVRAQNELTSEALLAARAELATLRLIVTEKFARDIEVAVKPEDAADVAKWAANASAVRELLRHTPTTPGDEYETSGCPRCEARAEQGLFSTAHDQHCPIAAAWRALGDPRGAEDIERAHEEALREQANRLPRTATHGEWVDLSRANPFVRLAADQQRCGAEIALDSTRFMHCGQPVGHEGTHRHATGAMVYFRMNTPPEIADRIPFSASPAYRLASESQDAANQREQHAAILRGGIGEGARVLARQVSDARGMEVVEYEARTLNMHRGFSTPERWPDGTLRDEPTPRTP